MNNRYTYPIHEWIEYEMGQAFEYASFDEQPICLPACIGNGMEIIRPVTGALECGDETYVDGTARCQIDGKTYELHVSTDRQIDHWQVSYANDYETGKMVYADVLGLDDNQLV
jgi:hypothetical protein